MPAQIRRVMRVLFFGDIHGPKPYKLIGFGDIHGPKPCKLIGFGDIHGPQGQVQAPQPQRRACPSAAAVAGQPWVLLALAGAGRRRARPFGPVYERGPSTERALEGAGGSPIDPGSGRKSSIFGRLRPDLGSIRLPPAPSKVR